MRFKRRRSDRPDSARNRLGSNLEVLEVRTLLSRNVPPLAPGVPKLFSAYIPQDLSVTNPITGQASPYSVQHQLHNAGPQSSLLGNEGKIVSGTDRQGNIWTITVHGPGTVIVTDTSPLDGSLDDAIDTIQLVGTNINKTYVTGNVVPSNRVLSDGTMQFNRLIDSSGVRSVILNGFTLGETVTPAAGTANNVNTGIFLTGGVRQLSFHNINAPIDTSTGDAPINVVIGDPSTPLKVQPSIHLDSIFNTVFDSTSSSVPANVAQTTPTVNIIVNGQIKDLSFISTTNTNVPAGDQFLFPTVATTGRTSVQATAVGNLDVKGAATNLTVSRGAQPFQNGFSGLSKLKSAHFHSTTDAVGIDVNGPVGLLQYDKGMGNPTGVFTGSTTTGNPTGAQTPATQYGLPADQTSYAAAGLVAGQVTATKINRLHVKAANVTIQQPSNPSLDVLTGTGEAPQVVTPGNALTNAVVTTSGNIGKVKIVGTSVNSEIKTGFHYPSYAAGLEGTRAASKIGSYRHNGSLLNSVTSATYRANNGAYGTSGDTKGPGKIRGNLTGVNLATGGTTALGNTGAGVYAKKKSGGYLPPPEGPNRVNGVLVK